MFYYEIPRIYQDLKGENLCFFNMYSIHAVGNTGPVTRGHDKSSQMKNKTPL